MKPTILAALISTTLMVGCGNSNGAPLSGAPQNVGERALQELFEANSYECDGVRAVSNMYYHAPGTTWSGTYATWDQFSDLGFEVQEAEISGADKMNGVTFAGWIVFDENTAFRSRNAWQRPNGMFDPFNDWSNWEPIRNGSPDLMKGHYLEFKNGKFVYSARGSGFYGELKLLTQAFSSGGLKGVQRNRC